MKNATIKLQIITPCFCAGADQSKAEIRPASIRGELRWWFRVLGGSPEQEKAVFGGVHGNFGESNNPNDRNVPKASSLLVRVANLQARSDERDLPNIRNINHPLTYLYYFASVSGKQKGVKGPGPRWKREAFFSPGTTFELQIAYRFGLDQELHSLVERAIGTFKLLGSIGTRATRGCGAVSADPVLSRNDLLQELAALPHLTVYELRIEKDWKQAQASLGRFLKEFRRDHHLSGKRLSALGSADPRHTSCLRLRPVKIREGFLPVLLYTERTLADRVRGIRPLLEARFRKRTA